MTFGNHAWGIQILNLAKFTHCLLSPKVKCDDIISPLGKGECDETSHLLVTS